MAILSATKFSARQHVACAPAYAHTTWPAATAARNFSSPLLPPIGTTLSPLPNASGWPSPHGPCASRVAKYPSLQALVSRSVRVRIHTNCLYCFGWPTRLFTAPKPQAAIASSSHHLTQSLLPPASRRKLRSSPKPARFTIGFGAARNGVIRD